MFTCGLLVNNYLLACSYYKSMLVVCDCKLDKISHQPFAKPYKSDLQKIHPVIKFL